MLHYLFGKVKKKETVFELLTTLKIKSKLITREKHHN